MSTFIERFITESLSDLAAAREHEAACPSGGKPVIPGETHCESCGFHYSTPVHVATWRDACKTPAFHMQDWNDSPDLWCECDSPICELA